MWIRVVILLVFFLLCGCGYSDNSSEPALQEKPSSEQQDNAGGDVEPKQAGDGIKYPPNSHIRTEDIQTALDTFVGPVDAKKEEHKETRADRDLIAQIAMALAAAATVGTTIYGLVLLHRTLKATKAAAQSASDTLGVAQDTLTQQRDASEKQLRPYVLVHDITLVDRVTAYNLPKFEVRVKNYGQTPAINIEQRVGAGIISPDVDMKAKFGEYVPPKYSIGSGREHPIEVGIIRQDVDVEICKGVYEQKLRCFGFGYIKYTGIQNNRTYRTIFHFNLERVPNMGWRIIPTKNHNKVT